MRDGAKAFIKNVKTGKHLFVQRDNKPDIPNPNKWSLVGGGIETGEKPEEALIREIEEETKLRSISWVLLDSFPLSQIVDNKSYLTKIYLYSVVVEDSNVELSEGQRAEWFTFDDAFKLDLVPKLRELMDKYRDRL